ncbi:2-polyprenyl-6-methoxyphenol hydroxylase [Asanoa hainanensis]|uniref:2-polyprenyl-6-methoxyphenol hydroxylase n=1 Tax=Asanoa hainanensis TaxID=560556 RepID=A0A239PFX9_9ACTN|nr:2-polyprenyl-6-methoxyphenol hydroxylase [Asanoa hainanensis]
MLGLLLARQGVDVVVLEKHSDFLRDFRGDTVHPSTLNLLDELGLGEALAARPGRKVDALRATFDDGSVRVADFSRLPGAHPYVLFLPQWDFLDLLAEEAAKLPTFRLVRSAEVVDVIRGHGGRVAGVRVDDGREVRARFTVGCDGRGSVVRSVLGLRPKEFGAPMDVLWFRVSRRPDDPVGLDMRVGAGGLMLCIDRDDYFQCAYVIAKGGYDEIKTAGLGAFRDRITARAPHLKDRVGEVASWDDVRLLTVRLDRLRQWSVPGALLIGDAAHAMSPIGGVGINLAVQDAVATARILGPGLAAGSCTDDDLHKVQRRRQFPTAVTQAAQRLAQRRVVDPLLHLTGPVDIPGPMRLLDRTPRLQRMAARAVGLGVRPEHL